MNDVASAVPYASAAPKPLHGDAALVRNGAEQLAYSTDKLIKDNEDKLPDDVKSEVQADVDALNTALAGDDDEAVKTAFDKLSESQQKLGQAIYSAGQAEQPAGEPSTDDAPESDDEDIVDAEVVEDDDDQKKQ